MFKYCIQFLIILLLWQNNNKAKKSRLTSSSVLIGIYVVCSFMGVVELHLGDYTQPYNSNYWLPMLGFDLFILVYLLPFRQFDETQIKCLVLPNRKLLNVFSNIVILFSLFSIIYYAGAVRNIFSMGNLKDLRDAHEVYFEVGILSTIGSVSAANYVFAIVLYFIYSIIGDSEKRCKLLLLSSISEPIHVLSFVGRDGIVFWLFTFIFCYAFFRPYMDYDSNRKALKPIIILGSVILFPFIIISISRFGENSGTGASIISYMGHAFLQGPLFFGIENKPLNIGASFPLFYELTGVSRNSYNEGYTIIGDWVSWKFSTFIISLYVSLSLSGLIIVTILMYFFFYKIFLQKRKKAINLGYFTIYLLYFQLISQGVFYFKQYTRGGNLFIITTLVIALFLNSISKKNHNKIILYKK